MSPRVGAEISARGWHGALGLVHVMTVPESFVFLRGQVGYMHARGFRVTALSSPGAYQETFRRLEPAEVASVPMARRITPLRDVAAVWRLAHAIRARRPAIVHAHTPKAGLLGMAAARLAGVPVRIYHMRGLPFVTAAGARRRLLMGTERAACALADRVICVSHSVRDVAVEAGLCPPEKIITLLGGSGNGVDATERFAPRADDAARRIEMRRRWGVPDRAPLVAFVGRLVRDKGVVELAQAWAEVREWFPAAHLVVAGPVEPRDPVPTATLDALRGDARVHLLGPILEPRDVYLAADVVTLPTHREGFPNVPLEAASMLRPVVATRIPGCVDAVAHGETGLLVPARDSVALAAALGRYLGDAALRTQHGARARARVCRDFDRRRIWDALYDEYCALLGARGLRAPGEYALAEDARRPGPASGAPPPDSRAFAATREGV